MFNLESQIREWCESIQTKGHASAASIEELTDHLWCEIKRLQDDGLSEERAFFAATKRMGNADDLAKEYSKNSDLMSRLCQGRSDSLAHERQQGSGFVNPKQSAFIVIFHALLHAGAILIASALLRDSEHADTVTYLIIALWFASSMFLIPVNQKSARCEWALIRQLFRAKRS